MSRVVRGMTKIIEGVRVFQDEIFEAKADLFEKLGKGQSPLVLFITCSDSRINPNLLTQTEPGELFILRNAGNIVPAFGLGGGEEATIEYAVAQLKVRHIVICGHSGCGAVQGLLDPKAVASMPSVARWLEHAKKVAEDVQAAKDLTPSERFRLAIQKNVLAQMAHLHTHPAVSKAVARGALKAHGWVYDLTTGNIDAYDTASQSFNCLTGRKQTVPESTAADSADLQLSI
jgi:carbonic anhydrase